MEILNYSTFEIDDFQLPLSIEEAQKQKNEQYGDNSNYHLYKNEKINEHLILSLLDNTIDIVYNGDNQFLSFIYETDSDKDSAGDIFHTTAFIFAVQNPTEKIIYKIVEIQKQKNEQELKKQNSYAIQCIEKNKELGDQIPVIKIQEILSLGKNNKKFSFLKNKLVKYLVNNRYYQLATVRYSNSKGYSIEDLSWTKLKYGHYQDMSYAPQA